jgi:hypothetical protein
MCRRENCENELRAVSIFHAGILDWAGSSKLGLKLIVGRRIVGSLEIHAVIFFRLVLQVINVISVSITVCYIPLPRCSFLSSHLLISCWLSQ